MAKVGRPRNLDSPEQLYELFTKYKDNVKANPRIKHIFGGKDFEERCEPLECPLTMEGFEIYCWDKVGTIEDYLRIRIKHTKIFHLSVHILEKKYAKIK